ncbi:hypothetical protein [Cochleicola gelatinilyticus]|uniref:Uncharacterized protein n=1 Tax=Cochleicola gelatinilyticus TaxID=1763537 RepID=A0A167G820_9FLAO|nr:hypothetical protein [Cochleicola gelatinilyticus]OAB77314.1 hypothetical protein ULVI_12485 [Cochleicola gelatinilyticus]
MIRLTLLIFLISFSCFSQVGINTITPSADAILDIESSDKGMLVPRVAIPNLNSIAPITGGSSESLLVYNTNATTGKGFYYWSGSQWVSLRTAEKNIYTDNGSLNSNREVSQNANTLQFTGNVGRNALTIKRTSNTTEAGLAFRNSGNFYDASIYMEANPGSGLVIATGTNQGIVDDVVPTVIFNDDTSSSFSNEVRIYEGTANAPGEDVTTRVYSNGDDGVIAVNQNGATNHQIHGNNTTYFNDQQLDVDFRVATHNNANTIFVDGDKDNVGIGTGAPHPGAALHISNNNKGFLAPQVSLTGITDNTTIQPSNTEGMMVYNIADTGSTFNDVSPGYYYWTGSIWNRLSDRGYSMKYKQTAAVRASANSSTYRTLTGLDKTITVPVSGTYQILVNAYYAIEQPTGTTNTGGTVQHHNSAGQGSIRLRMNNTKTLEEKYVASYGMAFPDGQKFYAHGQSVTMIINIDLIAGQNYQFAVQGREWSKFNSTTEGVFGWNTASHIGSNGVGEAQYGDMTITLINQY